MGKFFFFLTENADFSDQSSVGFDENIFGRGTVENIVTQHIRGLIINNEKRHYFHTVRVY